MNAEEVQEKMDSLLPEVFPGEYVTKWVCIIETMDDKGERGVWQLAAKEMKSYETMGFLSVALAQEQAKIIEDRRGE